MRMLRCEHHQDKGLGELGEGSVVARGSSRMQLRASMRSPHFWVPQAAPVLTAGRNRPRDVHYPGRTSAGAGGTRWQDRAGDSETWVRVWRNQVRSCRNTAGGSGWGGWEVGRSDSSLWLRATSTGSVCLTNHSFFSWSFSTAFVTMLFAAWGPSGSRQSCMEPWENE